MHGLEAALRAHTPIREDRTQQGRCFVFSSSIRSQKTEAASVGGRSRDVAFCPTQTDSELPDPLRLPVWTHVQLM